MEIQLLELRLVSLIKIQLRHHMGSYNVYGKGIYESHFYRPHSLVKQGVNVLGSVCPSVSTFTPISLPVKVVSLFVCNQWAYAVAVSCWYDTCMTKILLHWYGFAVKTSGTP